MRKPFIIFTFLICLAVPVSADTVVFKDGTRIDVVKAWEDNGRIKCKISGVVIGYPKRDVKRIIRQRQSSYGRQLKASEIAALNRKQPGSCYDLGKRFGHCTTLILYGEECPPQDDILLPSRCSGHSDTENGMLEGIGLANKSLDSAPADEPEISAEHPSVCFELGIRYGKCATLSMFGQTCDANDDIVMPLDCRGKADTKIGVRTGVRAAYKDMGLPAK